MSKAAQPYSKPPITEAVIEFRHAGKIEQSDLAKANKRFTAFYPNGSETDQHHVEINVDPKGRTTSKLSPTGKVYRRASDNEHNVLMLNPNSLVVAQSPPYPGWLVFCERIMRDWTLWQKTVGSRDLIRVGLRYINRIDIQSNEATINPSDFLSISLNSPEDLGPTISYAVNGSFQLPAIKAGLTIMSGVISPPPVPNHLSILLDLDVGKETDLPQSEEGIMTLLTSMRDEKNRVFESLITEQSRMLFR
jgi:uncharacterized protein (TIGR04255 family)